MFLENQGNVSLQGEQKAQTSHISMKLHAYAISSECVTKKFGLKEKK